MKEKDFRHRETFLFKNGGYIVYLIFLIALIINLIVSIHYFGNASWLFGIWALVSIFIISKAVLGLILLVGHKSIVFLNMPMIIWKVFPWTMQRYRSDALISFYHPILKGFIRELFWLGIGLFPLIYFFL